MKKALFLSLVILFLLILVTVITSITIAYKEVRPTAKTINLSLEDRFLKVVNIPRENATLNLNFDQVLYHWEMETPQNEVVGMLFKYNPDYLQKSTEIVTKLEIAQNGDASIFSKVLPAIIVDNQSLKSAQVRKEENLGANTDKGYESISIERNEEGQPTAIYWIYKLESLNSQDYANMKKYPEPLLRFLYELPNMIATLFAG